MTMLARWIIPGERYWTGGIRNAEIQKYLKKGHGDEWTTG
jgi:hypothetical protein